MLKIKNIKKSFKYNNVLTDINLNVKKGDLIHIKGVNGSGKSTLLKIIASLMEPDSGEIQFSPGVNLGALIENPYFIENETAAYNLQFLYNLKNSFDEEKVKSLFQKLQLDYDLRTPIKKYSVGMRQKVGIIQAIMEDQNLILFDEPTRGLDEKSIIAFNELIEDAVKQEKAIIICAHDGVESIPFKQRYVLENGVLKNI